MLICENCEEGVFELLELLIAAPRYRYRLALAGCRLLLDEVLDVIIVNVILDLSVSRAPGMEMEME